MKKQVAQGQRVVNLKMKCSSLTSRSNFQNGGPMIETSRVAVHLLIVFACRCSFVQELQAKTEQICEMAAVMSEAIHIDDQAIQQEQERMASIESENRGLRELLKISGIAIPAKEEKASPEETDAPVDGPSSSASQ